MDARSQLIQQYMQKRGIRASRKRPRDDKVYQELYNITKCQNTKMRSEYSNNASNSSKEDSSKPVANNSCTEYSQANPN